MSVTRGAGAARGLLGAAALAAAALLIGAPAARAAHWNWSGSASLVHTDISGTARPQDLANTGSITEWSLKATVDVTEKLTVNAKICSGCHGFMVDQASGEIRAHPLANFEVGRINVPFGEYTLRHDPANDVLPTKPLPYEMGHMLRYQATQFNLGVIPVPYVDSGASMFGSAWLHETTQIWYALYAVNGFRSASPRDFTFKDQTATGGFSDNNGDTSWGARLSVAHEDLALGASYLHGRYDPAANYPYEAWGVDASLRVRALQLRYEYLERSTRVDAGGYDATLRKKGFYLQAELAATEHLGLVGRLDGLLREGPPVGTVNDDLSGILRGTVGLNISPSVEYSVRLDYEHWRFTDFDDADVVHTGVVIAY